MPKITDEFHGLAQVSWYGAVYFLTLGAFRPFWGKVCRYFPLKPTFLFTIAFFELGSLICGVAPNSTTFIVGRALAGVGGAGIATGGTTIVALSVPPRKRPMFMGFLGVAAALGNITGPLLGGAFSDKVTWRWCFYINLPFGAVVAGLVLIFLRLETKAKTTKTSWKQVVLHMDIAGITLTLCGMVCFILALQYGGVMYPWKSSQVIGLLVGFVLIEAALGVWEYHQGEYALLPWRLIKQRALWATCLFQFFFAGTYFVILYYLPIYFQSIQGVSPLKSGVYNLSLVIAFGASILAGGIAVAVTGHATPFMAAGAILTCVSAGLFFSMGIDTPSAKWIGYQVLAGAAIAFPYMNCLSLAQANVDDGDISIMSSIVQCKSFFSARYVHTTFAELLYRFSDTRGIVQCLCRSVSLHQPIAQCFSQHCFWSRSDNCDRDWCSGAPGHVYSQRAPRCHLRLHQRNQGRLCSLHRHGWCRGCNELAMSLVETPHPRQSRERHEAECSIACSRRRPG